MTDTAVVATMFLLLAACGESKAPTAAHPGGGGMGGQASFDAPCFEPQGVVTCGELFPHETAIGPVQIADSASLGLGAEFTRLGGWAALVEFATGQSPEVVLAQEGSSSTSYQVDRSDAGGELRILSVWGEAVQNVSDALAARAVALGCNASGCQLLSASPEDPTLRVDPAFALPSTAQVEQLVGGRGRLCAFGAGLFCLDGGAWMTSIPAEVSGPITAVTLSYPAAAVAADGTLFVENDAGDWAPAGVVVEGAVRIESTSHTLSLLAADGTWTVVSLDPSGVASCVQSPPLALAVPGSSPFGSGWRVADERGQVFGERQTYDAPNQPSPGLTWCQSSAGVSEPLRGANPIQCADGTNVLSITASGFFSLLGAISCPLM